MIGSTSGTRLTECSTPVASRAAKAQKADDAIFQLYSLGFLTGLDSYLYSFSRDDCANNARQAVSTYQAALREWQALPAGAEHVATVTKRHASGLHWNHDLTKRLQQGKLASFSKNEVWTVHYRPFVKQYCYVARILAKRKHQMDHIFPFPDSDNRAISIPGVGSTKPFSTLMVNAMPDLEVVSKSQCFPRYRYTHPSTNGADLFGDAPPLKRIDNISDTSLADFRKHYADDTITKDAIFDYVYGVLHAPDFRERFATAFAKELPRVPMAPDFHAFAAAGQALARLHLEYETCAVYPLKTELTSEDPQPEHFRIGNRAMRYSDDAKTTLIVNDHVRLSGIPAEAHRYAVNGRTPLGWFIDRYRISTDKRSGITNDPNGWFDDPRDLIAAIRRIVHMSVETVRIVDGLPKALT